MDSPPKLVVNMDHVDLVAPPASVQSNEDCSVNIRVTRDEDDFYAEKTLNFQARVNCDTNAITVLDSTPISKELFIGSGD